VTPVIAEQLAKHSYFCGFSIGNGAAENHGRENLNLTINDDMTFTLKGKIEVFEEEFAQIGLQSELASGQRTYFFGSGDSLILKWEHLVE